MIVFKEGFFSSGFHLPLGDFFLTKYIMLFISLLGLYNLKKSYWNLYLLVIYSYLFLWSYLFIEFLVHGRNTSVTRICVDLVFIFIVIRNIHKKRFFLHSYV